MTLDLKTMSLSPILGIDIAQINKNYRNIYSLPKKKKIRVLFLKGKVYKAVI